MTAVNGELGDNARQVDVPSLYYPLWKFLPTPTPTPTPPPPSPPLKKFA